MALVRASSGRGGAQERRGGCPWLQARASLAIAVAAVVVMATAVVVVVVMVVEKEGGYDEDGC